jgi:DNA/RNA-binding domain of Phe-tRNA-synthetase-like protein
VLLRFAAGNTRKRKSVLSLTISTDPHPLLRAGAFITQMDAPLGACPSPAWLTDLLRLDVAAPVQSDDNLRGAIRDLLRHGGYKPTGRGKPASEYLIRAASEGALGSINLVVDACNVVSLHSGFPISVVDLGHASPPFRIALPAAGSKYVFNASGQEIDVSGLLSLFDSEGPCANAVKDAQRTKTNTETIDTLSVVWGCAGYEDRLAAAVSWYRELLGRAGLRTETASLQ